MKSTCHLICCLVAAALWSCSGGEESPPSVSLPIRRAVSLSPSITREILDLGSGEVIVGVTTYGPQVKKGVATVGSLVRPSAEAIALLRPDIVLLSEEDGAVQRTEQIAALGIPVRRFGRNADFQAICANYLALADLLGKRSLAEEKLLRYRRMLRNASRPAARPPLVALFLSAKPLIAASDNSFVGNIIRDAGGRNCYADVSPPYPSVSLESLVRRAPDLIIFISGGDLEAVRREVRRSGSPASERALWRVVPPDRMAYYTPADYVASVEVVAALLAPLGGR
ncbi:MAG: ABC transporter substrate-binding protein [Spirochaetes bacterium]|nr:ABC transporter substrate-binding protein [Spirochaetota bacterium]